jgi:hypothetical protein
MRNMVHECKMETRDEQLQQISDAVADSVHFEHTLTFTGRVLDICERAVLGSHLVAEPLVI